MSTLKVNKLRDTAGSADAITLDPNGGAVLAGVTTMTTARVTSGIVTNTFIVGAGVTISESGIEASGIGITCASINGTQIGGRRNIVINGAMNIAQRGTSSTSASYATVDRFRLSVANTDQAAYTQKQVTDSPDDFSSSYEFDVTTAETSLESTEYAFIGHRIEAQNLQSVKANQVTLSFHVKSYQTGTYAINLYQQDGNIHITRTYTISSSATWEKKTITFAANTGTQPSNDNGFGWEIAWIMAAGSGVSSSDSTSWGTYSDAGFAYGQGVNVLSSTDNYFKITGVQLEVGSQATAFEHRSVGEELDLCKRYYQSYQPYYNSAQYLITNEIASNTVFFHPEMRTTPTATHGALSCRENTGSFADVTVSSNYLLNSKGINYVVTKSGASTSDSFIIFVNNAEYDAEL